METILKISEKGIEINGKEINTVKKCTIEFVPLESPKVTLEFDTTEISVTAQSLDFS